MLYRYLFGIRDVTYDEVTQGFSVDVVEDITLLSA